MASHRDNEWQSTKMTALERNTYVFNTSSLSDITFTCGDSQRKHFHVHKYVLATCSVVFESMFYGRLAEQASIIDLPDTDAVSLHEFFRFLYTESCTITPNNVRALMYLGQKYIVPSLTERCVNTLSEFMQPGMVLEYLEEAKFYGDKELIEKCWNVIDKQTSEVVSSEAFSDISQETLIDLLKRDTLYIAEVDLFKAVLKWSEIQCSKNGVQATDENKRKVLGNAVHEIRFRVMSQEEFTQHVFTSGLLPAEKILQMFGQFNSDSPHVPVVRRRGKQPYTHLRVQQRFRGLANFLVPAVSFIKFLILMACHCIAQNVAVSLIYLKVWSAHANFRLFRLLIVTAVLIGLHLVLSNVFTSAMILVSSFLAVFFISIYLFFGDDELSSMLIDSATFTMLMMIVSLSLVTVVGR